VALGFAVSVFGLTVGAVASPAYAAVTSAFRHGTLVLRGDDGADVLTIDGESLGPGAVRVTPEDGTTLDGTPDPQTFTGITSNLQIALRGGDNAVAVRNATLPRDLMIAGRDGSDDVFVGSTNIDGNVLVAFGPGDNHFLMADGSRVNGDLAYRGGPDADEVAFIFSASVIGSIRVALGDGVNEFVAGDAGNLAGGTLRVKGGRARDFIAIGDDSFVGGDARFDVADGENLVVLDFGFSGEDVVVHAGRDHDVVRLDGAGVFGSARLDVGAGDNQVDLGGGITGDLLVKAGAGADTVTTVDTGGLFVNGATRLELGDGMNSVGVEFTVFNGPLEVTGGRGDDTVDFDYFVELHDSAAFALGDGNNAVSLQQTSVAGDLAVTTGAGDDTVRVFDTTTIAGQTLIDTGRGTDVVGP
jgi:fibronectin-binding autotransporter adhesin